MRNLLALAALGVLVFLGLGWYLGWYKIQSQTAGDGHRQIEIDLNTNKIKTDLNKGESKVHDWLNEKDGTKPQSSTTNPTNSTNTSFKPAEDAFVFPGANPTPPTGGATLPTPR